MAENLDSVQESAAGLNSTINVNNGNIENEVSGRQIRQVSFSTNTKKNTSTINVEQIDYNDSIYNNSVFDDDDDDGDQHHLNMLNEHNNMKWYKKPRVSLLAFIKLIQCIGDGSSLSSLINLTIIYVCQHSDNINFGDLTPINGSIFDEIPSICYSPTVQSITSRVQLKKQLISGIIGMIVASRLGALSDRIGRKPIMLYNAIISLLNTFLFIYIIKMNEEKSKLYYLILLSFIEGLSGGMSLSLAMSNSYVADCLLPKDRSKFFGRMIAVMLLGIGLGPLIGGYIIKLTGTPFGSIYFAISCNILYLILLSLIVPESLTKNSKKRAKSIHFLKIERKRRLSEIQIINNIKLNWIEYFKQLNFIEPLGIFFWNNKKLKSTRSKYNMLMLVFMEISFTSCTMGISSVLLIYITYAFQWNSSQTSFFISTLGISKGIALLILLPIILRILKKIYKIDSINLDMIDITMMRIGIIVELFGNIGLFLSKKGIQFLIVIACMALSTTISPALQSALIKHTPSHKIGELQGALALLTNITSTLAPAIFLYIYSLTVKTNPRIFFLVLVSIMTPIFIATFFFKHDDLSDDIEGFDNFTFEPQNNNINDNHNVSETSPLLENSN